MERILALVLSGLAQGAITSLVALGFVLLYKATGLVNFAHGDLVTLGAYVAVWLSKDLGAQPLVALLVATALLALLGAILERITLAPLRSKPPMAALVATLAAALVIRGGIAVWQGSTPRSLPPLVSGGPFLLFGAAVDRQRIVIIVTSLLVIGLIALMFRLSSFGRQLRTLAANIEMASLLGIRTGRMSIIAFTLSAALAGLAGILVAPIGVVDPNFGFALLISAFAAAVLGGFDNLMGVVLGGVLLGVCEQLLGGLWLRNWATVLPYVVILIVITFKPDGLLPKKSARI